MKYPANTAKLLLVFLVLAAGTAAAQETGVPPPSPEPWVILSSPGENGSVVARKPTIVLRFLRAVKPESVTVVIDGTDYTQVAVRSPQGLEVTPPLPLPAGSHQVTVAGQDPAGQPLAYAASFSSRHTKLFDEVTSASDLTGLYELAVHKPASADNSVSNAREELNLTTSNALKSGPWRLSLVGNARSKDQSLPIPPPERRGADIVSYTFKGGYEKEGFRAEAAVGDVLVNETPYTLIALGRRGATFEGAAGPLTLHAFSVRSDSVYGTRGGLSVDGGTDTHIRGGSGSLRLFQNKLELKTVYVTGGERQSSYNIATLAGAREGDALGFQLTTDFFSGRFRTDMEADFSRFTPDASLPDSPSRDDHAFRAGAVGALGTYTYEALFEYVGQDYEVIGNPGLPRDRMGGKVGAGAALGHHHVGATVSRYSDNVKDDPLRPVNVNWQAGVTYGLTRWTSLPVNLSYQFDRQRAEDVPEGQAVTLDRITHTANGQVAYVAGIVYTALSGMYTRTEDRALDNADTSAWTVRLAPTVTFPTVSLTPSAAYTEGRTAPARTETTTLGLDGRSTFLENRVTADLGATYVFTRASDGSQDNRNLTGNFRVGYNFTPLLSGLFRPSLAFHGTYLHLADRINPTLDKDEWTLFLTFSAQIPVVL